MVKGEIGNTENDRSGHNDDKIDGMRVVWGEVLLYEIFPLETGKT